MTTQKAERPLLRLFPVLLLNLTAFGVSIPIIPALCEALGGTGVEVGALFALQALGQFFMAPMWGKLSDRFGRKPILLVTILGAIIADVITSFSASMFLLFGSRLLAGLFAGNVATASALIADATDEKSRSKGMAIVGICFGLGFTLGPTIGAISGYLTPDDLGPLGRGFPFLVAAALNLFAVTLGSIILREASTDAEARGRSREKRDTSTILGLLKRKPIMVMSVFFVSYSIATSVMETTLYLYMSKLYGYDERQVGLLFGAFGLLAAFVQGGVGRISAKLGDKRMTLAGAIMLSIGLVSATLYEELWFLVAFLGLSAIGRALLQPGGMALMSSHAESPAQTGKVMGVMQSSMSMGRIIGPLLGGLFYDQITYYAPFIGAGCIIAIAAAYWSAAYPGEGT